MGQFGLYHMAVLSPKPVVGEAMADAGKAMADAGKAAISNTGV